MIKKIQNFYKKMFSEKLAFRERMNHMVLLLVFAASVIGTGRVFLGADSRVLYALLAMCAVSGIAIYIAVTRQNQKLASWLLIIGTNMILFPIVFILSGGTQSGTPVWFVLGLVYIFLLFEGRSFLLAFALSALSFLLTYLVSYYNPMILPPSTRFYGFTDSFVTLLCVSCFIGILMKSQARTYERERQIAEQQKREVEQMARSKDTFFANMSHEIRTPINTIIGLNEMILREDISDEIAENAINIQNASKMLLTTINDILDLSKLESGKMDIVPTQYEISSMFSDLVNLVWIRAHQKDLEFKVDIDPEIPSMLYGDEVRIKQVVTNLLTNAVKYTETGSVTLTAKCERIAADQILLRISVQDTGMGIRKESLDDLFNSFKRVDETENRNIEGTGLGLSISKQLMDMMGGKLTVDSVYHQGSTFTIELKQRIVNVRPIGSINFAAQKQLSQRTRYQQTFIAPDARILVVDDNAMNLMVAVKLLRDTKVQVDTAESGKDALKKTAEVAYHLILMDHMMPEMDGIEAVHIIRNECGENGRRPIIIALTANAMEGVRETFLENGFQDFITKPLDRRSLHTALLRWISEERRTEGALLKDTDAVEDSLEDSMQIPGIDMEEVFSRYSSSLEDYLELLELYCLDGKRKLALLRKLWEERDYKNYGIEVHGLKSASANVGAMGISKRAKAQEYAVDRGDTAYVDEHAAQLLEAYEAQISQISHFLEHARKSENADGKARAIAYETFAGEIKQALEHLENFHAKDCAHIVEALLQCQLKPEIAAKLKDVQGQLKLYEDEAAEQMLRELLEIKW